MIINDTPTDPQALRAEIAQTRAGLGATVEALAARTDVTGRAMLTVGDLADGAKAAVRGLRDRAAHLVDAVTAPVRAGAESALGVVIRLVHGRRP